jgi:Na+-driven multidrug efflux pump
MKVVSFSFFWLLPSQVSGFVAKPFTHTILSTTLIAKAQIRIPLPRVYYGSTSDESEDILPAIVKQENKKSEVVVEPPPPPTDGVVIKASKRQMLGFAIPALGIYLSNPLLSNIDNAFVGRTIGTQGLAALSPATICTDQMLYLFSFLARATTGLVSRAYGGSGSEKGNVEAARDAASPPLTVALMCGFFLSLCYALFTPNMLAALNVNPALRGSAASYIYWRGAVAWAALAQSVALSVMMATRDSITPLKIIGLAVVVNIIGDFALCVWPLQWGCSGAAAATAFATLFSSAFMLGGLKRKGILPKIRIPSRKEWMGLMEFTGPLMAITVTRLIGFVNMQRTAMRLGVEQMAAYQLSINLVVFFLLFGEPLSQLSQTKLPTLLDAKDGPMAKATLKSVLTLGALTAVGMGTVAALTLWFGSGVFSSDLAVQALTKDAVPAVFLTVATAIFAGRWLVSLRDSSVWLVMLRLLRSYSYILFRCILLSFSFLLFYYYYSIYSYGRRSHAGQ